MRVIHNALDLRAALRGRADIALVPTMGNLHAGHLSLVRLAAAQGAPVVASIFVNPLQFAPHEDFARYPRTLDRDCQLLESAGCDVVFAPSERDMYPEPQTYKVYPPGPLADILEGHFRPGFFVGVCTVVLKLFNLVRPRSAIFGKKDYQQLLIVRGLVRQCALPIEVIAGETVREPDGLAQSSRNDFLPAQLRSEAAKLYREIERIGVAVRGGRSNFAELESAAGRSLAARGWSPDYISVRRRDDLELPVPGRPLVVVAAARLDAVRLIDNIEI